MSKSFENNGFEVISIKPLIEKLKNLKIEIFDIFSALSSLSSLGRINSDSDLINFRNLDQKNQYIGVKHLYNCPTLYELGGDQYFVDTLKSFFNINRPIHEVQPQLRVDMPIEGQSIFHQHQDYAFNLGSLNSVTVWIPLQDTTEKEGALLVAPGTHKKGVYKNTKGIIDQSHSFDFVSCPVMFGQALVFNQKLVHMSGKNTSEKIRYSIQLRYSDLYCNDYASRLFKINHQSSVIDYAKESLV
jgi:hypothetical protein